MPKSASIRWFTPQVNTLYAKPLRSRPEVPLNTRALVCTPAQRERITDLYANDRQYLQEFSLDPPSQAEAVEILLANDIDLNYRWSRGIGWSTRFSCSWGKEEKRRTRVLLQCCSGYDTAAGQEKHHPHPHKPWTRRASYDFTGCLAHVEVIHQGPEKHILRVEGYLEHNQGCLDFRTKRLPEVPLHPQVVKTALQQLFKGDNWRLLQTTNCDLMEAKAYPEMRTSEPLQGNFRYILLPSDAPSIYRQLNGSESPSPFPVTSFRNHDFRGAITPPDDSELSQYDISDFALVSSPSSASSLHVHDAHKIRGTSDVLCETSPPPLPIAFIDNPNTYHIQPQHAPFTPPLADFPLPHSSVSGHISSAARAIMSELRGLTSLLITYPIQMTPELRELADVVEKAQLSLSQLQDPTGNPTQHYYHA